jgi:hypothetical protein
VSDEEGKNFSLVNLGSLTKPLDTTTKGIIEGAGAFLSKVCLPAAEEMGLLFRDRVSYWRALNLAKILKKAESKLGNRFREVSPRPGVLRAAAAAEERSFRRRSAVMFLVPLVGALAALAVVLMRT